MFSLHCVLDRSCAYRAKPNNIIHCSGKTFSPGVGYSDDDIMLWFQIPNQLLLVYAFKFTASMSMSEAQKLVTDLINDLLF